MGTAQAQRDANDLSGRHLGGYRLIRQLGSGAMADVYLAEQESLSRFVAVKVLRPETTVRPAAVERFVQEARAAAGLVHGNIVQIHEVGCLDGIHFLVEEYVAGPSLKGWLEVRGPLDARQAVTALGNVGSALARAAQQGVVHRDIKPENLLLTRDGEVKVADFGLARVREQDLGLTQDGTTLGTPLYMSPEQAEGRDVDPRSDLYSLGATVYHLLAGRPPFSGTTGVAVAMAHVRDPLVPLESLRPDLPESLVGIVNRLLAKRADDRYATAADLLHAVESVALPSVEGSHHRASPLAWQGDLGQWAVGEAGSATAAFLRASGGRTLGDGLSPPPHARTQAIRAATTRLQMAFEDDRVVARSTRRFWSLVAVATVAAAGLGFMVSRQRQRRPEQAWRRNRG
ncbi:MAG: serine/threonine-protein kinase [Planctomycetota bacterium]|nr:serine/threonine-protein kinase [Planctomycetota bacterium]